MSKHTAQFKAGVAAIYGESVIEDDPIIRSVRVTITLKEGAENPGCSFPFINHAALQFVAANERLEAMVRNMAKKEGQDDGSSAEA